MPKPIAGKENRISVIGLHESAFARRGYTWY